MKMARLIFDRDARSHLNRRKNSNYNNLNMSLWNHKERFSFYALIFCCVFLFVAAFFYPKWNIPDTEATISWDVMGYYLYLPSFFYDDISQLHKLPYILHTYHPVYGFGNAFQLPNGNYIMKYSMGMAMMFLPFFSIAHFWAILGGYAVDGFSYPYQVMIAFGSIFISWIGLWFARKNLLKYFDDRVASVVLLLLVLATNYFNYVSYAGPMAHNYLFTIYSIVIWLTVSWFQKPSYWKGICLGALCGLATVTRPTEIIILIIPFLWGIGYWKELAGRMEWFLRHWKKMTVAAIAFFIPILPQLIYWKAISGQWLYYSYQDQGFNWTHPHFYEGILTFRNGWLVYTPVMALALVGFVSLFRKWKSVFPAVFLFTAINMYIVYAWNIWWYGGSFGSRAMVQSYALLILPMAAFIDWIRSQKILRIPIIAGILFCCYLNLLQTYQCHAKGIFEAENMTRAYYWRIFGKTSVDPLDKKFLDSKEEMPTVLSARLTLIDEFKSPLFDSLHSANSVSAGLLINIHDSIQQSKSFAIPVAGSASSWLRASASVFFPDKEWDVWSMTQFTLKLYANQKEVRNNMMRIQRNTGEGVWQNVTVDIHCPAGLQADTLKVYFWNANSKKQIYIDDLKIHQAME